MAYKYESYLKQCLLIEGEISLSQIGFFTLIKDPSIVEGNIPSAMLQINFEYNRRAGTSQKLLSFIAEKEKKNKQIIALDVESYLSEMRQLINTGKEFTIEGLGYLFLNKQGNYQFVQQSPDSFRADEKTKKKKQYVEQQKQSQFVSKKGIQQKSVSSVAIVIIFFIIAAAAWGIYYLVFVKNTTDVSVNQAPAILADTSLKNKGLTNDSTLKRSITPSLNDSVFYKFIFETTSDSGRAHSRVAKLRQYGDAASFDSMRTDTSMLYRLFIIKKILPADSAAAKDSVQKYFQRNIKIEKVNG